MYIRITILLCIHTLHHYVLYHTKLYSVLIGEFTGIEGQSGKNMCQVGKPDTGKFHSSYIGMNVCGSAYESGCVVDDTCATAAD